MSCEYAKQNGYQSALRKFHDAINLDLKKALEETKYSSYSSSQTDYWRSVGKRDILLQQLELINKWIHEE